MALSTIMPVTVVLVVQSFVMFRWLQYYSFQLIISYYDSYDDDAYYYYCYCY